MKRFLLLAEVAFIVCILLACRNESDNQSKILFTSKRDVDYKLIKDDPLNYEIYIIDSSGQNLKNLSNYPGGDINPAWSPDGNKIAYQSGRGPSAICVMKSDGSNQRILTSNKSVDTNPLWSPDGKKIAYLSRIGVTTLCVMKTDGTEQKKLLRKAGDRFSWSPDSTKIVCEITQLLPDTSTEYDICVIDFSNGEIIATINQGRGDKAPAWSPDAKKIAFTSEVDADYELYIMNSNYTDIKRLTYNGVDSHRFKWLPDSDHLVYISQGSNGSDAFYIIDTDGNLIRQIDIDGFIAYPSFSCNPGGTKMAFALTTPIYASETGDEGIYIIDIDGSNLRRLTSEEDWDPIWSP